MIMRPQTQSTVTSKREIKHGTGPWPYAAFLAAFLLLNPAVWAASYTVQMTGFVFSPNTLSIAQGDSVTWSNAGIFAHTATSGTAPIPNSLWNSGSIAGSGRYTVTYSNFAGGTYPFYCSFHYLEGMTGSLTITNAPATPPPLLTNFTWNSNQFQFTLSGPIGQSYVTETSTDLASWSGVSTNLAASTHITITDTNAMNPFAFYRVRLGQ